jgi:uroporphyrinogen-III synthase
MNETIVLTGSAGSFPGLVAALRQVPVRVEEHPLISFRPPLDWSQLDAALANVSRYQAIAFTSPRAARAVAERIGAGGLPNQRKPYPPVWAVGPATAAPLESALGPVRVPGSPTNGDGGPAATLARAMLQAGVEGPVLFPCGEKRRDDLPAILRSEGLEVDEVVCYRSVLASRSQAKAAAARGSVVVVASPSVMQLLVEACPPAKRPALITIGPTTAALARAAGWLPAAVASEPSTGGVASAIANLLTAGR